jgi:hypothetical protein
VLHYRLEGGGTLCGSTDGGSTRDRPWAVNCPACLQVAAAESIDQRSEPHPFAYPSHCAACNLNGPVRALRRDRPNWNGRW